MPGYAEPQIMDIFITFVFYRFRALDSKVGG